MTGLAVALAGAAGCGDGGPREDAAPPNLLLVVVDTLRADHLGVYGHARPTSPRIDALAAESTVFDSAYTAAPWTKPSVASLLTGLHPRSHTVTRMIHKLPDSVATLAEMLSERGWATGAVVSHNLIGTRQRFDQGFERFDEAEARGHRHVSTDGVTERAIAMLAELEATGRPWFLMVHYFDPHYDYMPHPEFGWAPPRVGRLRAGQMAKRAAELDPPPDADEVAFLRDLYDEEIRFTDAGIGRLLDALQASGRFDQTVVAVTADHGEEFYERGCLGHTRTLYEELVRVPLIVRDPRTPQPGRRIASPVSLVSFTPTALELLGAARGDDEFEAGSIAALVRGERDTPETTTSIYAEVDFTPGSRNVNRCPPTRADVRAVVRGRHKLMHDRLRDEYLLFDLEADPHERRDLSGERPKLFTAMRAELEREPVVAGRHDSEERTLDPAEIEMLRDLGYIERDDGS